MKKFISITCFIFITLSSSISAIAYDTDLHNLNNNSGEYFIVIENDDNHIVKRKEAAIHLLAEVYENVKPNPSEMPYHHIHEFNDLRKESVESELIDYARKIGLVRGYDNGEFRPNTPITREELAVITMRAARLIEIHGGKISYDGSFADNSIYKDMDDVSQYAKRDLELAVINGLLTADGSSELNPNEYATYSDLVKMKLFLSGKKTEYTLTLPQ